MVISLIIPKKKHLFTSLIIGPKVHGGGLLVLLDWPAHHATHALLVDYNTRRPGTRQIIILRSRLETYQWSGDRTRLGFT